MGDEAMERAISEIMLRFDRDGVVGVRKIAEACYEAGFLAARSFSEADLEKAARAQYEFVEDEDWARCPESDHPYWFDCARVTLAAVFQESA